MDLHKTFDDWADRYIEGEFEGAAEESIRVHLKSCDVCRGKLADRESIRRLLLEDEVPQPTAEQWADFHRRLRVRIGREKEKSAVPLFFTWRRASLGLAAAASLLIAVLATRDTGTPANFITLEMAAQEEILSTYPAERGGIPVTFGEAALDSVMSDWLLAEMDNQTLTVLMEAVEDQSLNSYGSDLIFSDVTDEELLLSLREVL
jgi:hypothetical protein